MQDLALKVTKISLVTIEACTAFLPSRFVQWYAPVFFWSSSGHQPCIRLSKFPRVINIKISRSLSHEFGISDRSVHQAGRESRHSDSDDIAEEAILLRISSDWISYFFGIEQIFLHSGDDIFNQLVNIDESSLLFVSSWSVDNHLQHSTIM